MRDLTTQTFVASDIIPLQASDPTAISRFAARFALLLDNPAVSDLDEVVITAMKCVHKLNMQLRESSYAENSRVQKQQFLKGSAMALIQFASGLRLRLGGDVYRQLSSMSKSPSERLASECRCEDEGADRVIKIAVLTLQAPSSRRRGQGRMTS